MGALVAFDPMNTRAARKPPPRPPADALERASWINGLLCDELFEITKDEKLGAGERRELVLKFAARITQSMPHHEIAEARDELRSDEGELKSRTLGGTVTRASGGSSRPIRASAPRRS